MAIQRYLATRDARAARRMFHLSLLSCLALWPFLAVAGLALMAYFLKHPEMLPAGHTVYGNGDQLLPLYIVHGLPAGASGLVIAALLAAAMSSLSSGLNSVCSVITSDFIGRFWKREQTERRRVRQAKYVSFVVGVIVVLLSSLFGYIEGNLLELCYKIANLLTVPLFMMFFMALFIPWATASGTCAGTTASLLVAVVLAYQQELGLGFLKEWGLSFVWMSPASFVVGAVTGMLVSLLPGRRRPMLR